LLESNDLTFLDFIEAFWEMFVVKHEPHLISGVEENVLFSRILREKFEKTGSAKCQLEKSQSESAENRNERNAHTCKLHLYSGSYEILCTYL
jgi:hypothetical protein